MSSIPPASEVIDALTHVVLPASAAAFAVAAVVGTRGSASRSVAASALALAAGFLAGNWCREALTLWPEPEWSAAAAFGATGTPPTSEFWLPWAAGLALLAGLAARLPGMPGPVGWVLRVAVATTATAVLVPAALRTQAPWLPWAFGGTVLGLWATLEGLARRGPGGWSALLPAVAFGAAAVVLLHAHTAKLTDVATLAGASLAGLAAGAWQRQSDAGGMAPGVAVLLPGVLLVGQQGTVSETLPASAFAVAALAPLAASVLLLPGASRLTGWRRAAAGVLLVLVPAGMAVALAVTNESLDFG